MSDLKFSMQPSISPTLVLIDAIARSGKAIFSDIVPSLSKMEHIQFCTEFELTIQGLMMSGLSVEYADAFLRIYFNELSYNLQISRNVNFRKKDQTGIPNFRNPQVYFDRLERDDGDEITKICSSRENLIPISTHELLVNYDQLRQLSIDYKMISLWRNPIDVISSWVTRGWGERFGKNDPRSFLFNVKRGSNVLPWPFALPALRDLAVTGPELCAQVVLALIDAAASNFKAETHGEVHVVTFEDMCAQPNIEMRRLCSFLDVELTDFTGQALKRARLPRPLSEADRVAKLRALEPQLQLDTVDRLNQYSSRYNADLYGMRA